MLNKWIILSGAVIVIGAVYLLSMRAVPGKGWMRAAEGLCSGIILCFLCSLILRPFGFQMANSPLAAFAAGCWGLPGAALAAFLAGWH